MLKQTELAIVMIFPQKQIIYEVKMGFVRAFLSTSLCTLLQNYLLWTIFSLGTQNPFALSQLFFNQKSKKLQLL